MKRNYIAYLNYSGTYFKQSYELIKSNDPNTVEESLKKGLKLITGGPKYGRDINTNVGIYTSKGTSALSNTASFSVASSDCDKTDVIKRLETGNSEKFQHILNNKLRSLKIPIKVYKIESQPEEFCARESALSSSYLFRFHDKDETNLNIFEYPFTTCIKRSVNFNELQNTISTLNQISSNLGQTLIKLDRNSANIFTDSTKHDSQINSIELKDLPINATFSIRKVLELIINGAELGKSELERQFVEILEKSNVKYLNEQEISNKNESFMNLNGLFVLNVNYKLIE